MTKTVSFNVRLVSDTGHGWLSVKLHRLKDLGIIEEISRFSYINGKSAYLEEDRDAGIFLKAAKEAGWNVNVVEGKPCDKGSPVRSYLMYSPELARCKVNK